MFVLPPRSALSASDEVSLGLVHHADHRVPRDPTDLEVAQAEARLRLTEQQTALSTPASPAALRRRAR